MSKQILCTLGPASLNAFTITRLTELKVDLFRLNLSHTDLRQLEEFVALIRKYSEVPICFDSQGAQVRTGTFRNREAKLSVGATVNVVSAPTVGTEEVIPLYPSSVVGQLRAGDLVSLDFNHAMLQIISTDGVCRAKVVCSGTVGTNKAVSIDRQISLPALTDIDVAAMSIARWLSPGNLLAPK